MYKVKIMSVLFSVTIILIVTYQFIQMPSLNKNSQIKVKSSFEITSVMPRKEYGNYDLTDIFIMNENDFWAVGYDGKHLNRVYYLKGNGKSLDLISVPESDCCTLSSIYFSDTQHGWAVGGQGLIIRTINGGKSWDKVNVSLKADLSAVHFINNQVGFVAGRKAFLKVPTDIVEGDFYIYCTKDGGETWNTCYKENKPISVYQISSISDSVILVLVGGKKLLKTEDQGVSWKELSIPMKSVRSIAINSDGTICSVGGKGDFWCSTNEGEMWYRVLFSGDSQYINWESINFNKKGIGLAVGENSAFAYTLDNGKTWELGNLQFDENLQIVKIEDFSAVVLGERNAYFIKLK